MAIYTQRVAFTLIELLIVVAIIAILAAIAVPNFLEAQTRAKISRNYADMRTAITGLETYRIDHNLTLYDGYNHLGGGNAVNPPSEYNHNRLSKHISTPVSYLNSANLPDPFVPKKATIYWQEMDVRYVDVESTYGTKWDAVIKIKAGKHPLYDKLKVEFGDYWLFARGPDGRESDRGWTGISGLAHGDLWVPYNATNGTMSIGNIIKSQRAPNGYVNASN